MRTPIIFYPLLVLLFMIPGPSVAKRHPGDSVTVGNTRFMIWGGAKAGVMPKGASVSPDGKWLFVSNFGRINTKNISVFHANPLTFKQYINYKGNSIESVVSPDSKTLYSTNMYGHYFDVIDIATMKHTKRVKVRGFPKVILLNRKGTRAYLSLWANAGFATVDLPSLAVSYWRTGRKNPRVMALSKDEKTLYLANNGNRNYTILQTASLVPGQKPQMRHIPLGRGPRHAVMSKDGKRLYISIMGSSSVAIIDTANHKVLRRVKVGRKPKTIELSHDGKFLYTADYLGHSMTIMDTTTFQTAILPLEIVKASGLTVHPTDKYIYVTGWCTDDIWAIQRINPGESANKPLGQGFRKYRGFECRKCPRSFMGCRRKDR